MMENYMTTMSADPVVAHPMTSCKDLTRTCPLSSLKSAEVDHSALTLTEKENLKHQWKQWIDATTHGFKDKLKEEGRLA